MTHLDRKYRTSRSDDVENDSSSGTCRSSSSSRRKRSIDIDIDIDQSTLVG